MLKLRIKTTKGPVDADTNISPEKAGKLESLEVKLRSQGVGSGFKHRAPNRVTLYLQGGQWRNVVLADNFDFDAVQGFEIYDSTKTQPPVQFMQESKGSLKFAALQPAPAEIISGTDRWAALTVAFQEQFPDAGGIGVNDTQDTLFVTVEVPMNLNSREYRESLNSFAEKQAERFGSQVEVIIKPVGAVGLPGGHPLMENQLGNPQHPTIPVAGTQPISPMNVSDHPSPTREAGVRPFDQNVPSGDQPLEVGQSFEPYGAEGPVDEQR